MHKLYSGFIGIVVCKFQFLSNCFDFFWRNIDAKDCLDSVTKCGDGSDCGYGYFGDGFGYGLGGHSAHYGNGGCDRPNLTFEEK